MSWLWQGASSFDIEDGSGGALWLLNDSFNVVLYIRIIVREVLYMLTIQGTLTFIAASKLCGLIRAQSSPIDVLWSGSHFLSYSGRVGSTQVEPRFSTCTTLDYNESDLNSRERRGEN